MTILNQDWIIPDWPAPHQVKACVTTRSRGTRTTGRSQPPYDAFNLGIHVGDDLHQVEQNRMALQRVLGLGKQPAWLNQVHSSKVVSWDAAQQSLQQTTKALDADASWSNKPQQACAIMTADCLPVLFTNKQGTVVAAVHAGWKGLAGGILNNTLNEMQVEPTDVLAWLGPAISAKNYEINDVVYQAFITAYGEAAKQAFEYTRESEQGLHYQLDLYAMARIVLNQAGVSAIYGGDFCSYDDARFYSYRQQNPTGRFASLIWLE